MAGVNIIEYSDHACWNDICHVVSPEGYNVYYDENHWKK